eukprot:1862822-Rhodomonas_salina.2
MGREVETVEIKPRLHNLRTAGPGRWRRATLGPDLYLRGREGRGGAFRGFRRPGASMCLCAWYAMSGADIACGHVTLQSGSVIMTSSSIPPLNAISSWRYGNKSMSISGQITNSGSHAR